MQTSSTPESVFPTPSEIKAALANLTHAEILRLAALSGCPFQTLWNVRSGKTRNPGIATVLSYWPHIDAAKSIRPSAA
jgi:hypothetical protein